MARCRPAVAQGQPQLVLELAGAGLDDTISRCAAAEQRRSASMGNGHSVTGPEQARP